MPPNTLELESLIFFNLANCFKSYPFILQKCVQSEGEEGTGLNELCT